jgi:hypothetical protein
VFALISAAFARSRTPQSKAARAILHWVAVIILVEWIEGEGDARVAWCEIARGDNGEIIKRKFSVEDAKRVGLWDTRPKLKRKDNTGAWREDDNDSPWYRYDERMLQMRARGLYIREEIEEERRRSDNAQDKVVVMDAEDLLPPSAPEEDLETPIAPAKPPGSSAPEAQAETIRDPDDFLPDLDVCLAACNTEDQLDEVWAENLETLCSLGMQPRQKAELIYDRHRSRISGQSDFAIHAGEKHSGVAA